MNREVFLQNSCFTFFKTKLQFERLFWFIGTVREELVRTAQLVLQVFLLSGKIKKVEHNIDFLMIYCVLFLRDSLIP